eukprot:scaffold17413_cov72-Phaeocystis_antarctica.AAC.9
MLNIVPTQKLVSRIDVPLRGSSATAKPEPRTCWSSMPSLVDEMTETIPVAASLDKSRSLASTSIAISPSSSSSSSSSSGIVEHAAPPGEKQASESQEAVRTLVAICAHEASSASRTTARSSSACEASHSEGGAPRPSGVRAPHGGASATHSSAARLPRGRGERSPRRPAFRTPSCGFPGHFGKTGRLSARLSLLGMSATNTKSLVDRLANDDLKENYALKVFPPILLMIMMSADELNPVKLCVPAHAHSPHAPRSRLRCSPCARHLTSCT